jgi:serine/threonine protein kinase
VTDTLLLRPADSESEICFSLTYAPPEVIKAYRAGQGSIMVSKATDVWALGVRRFSGMLLLHIKGACGSGGCAAALQGGKYHSSLAARAKEAQGRSPGVSMCG